ncbi:hypothetical protein AYY19_00820 [Photobacterium aquimaris]|uniref:Uncharacterized protein n=1 Tax=Photobacterium aquimaris TaxID=512643 RepID=A0A2T3IT53_9GAMM|nr:hypothetical protein AYY19_00820 [Photobacterium aquimaris]OBU20873.1 hypothetical protein AYY20_02560 [Photobacterium aquimaris]PSU31531.1 hypothetical protein CTM88_00990 [Photobacterium aquimaris]PSW03215.1 hypothetical protein CTM91_02815 [Photobacterium aquimaris]
MAIRRKIADQIAQLNSIKYTLKIMINYSLIIRAVIIGLCKKVNTNKNGILNSQNMIYFLK